MYGEVKFSSLQDEFFLPSAHFFSFPAYDCILIDGKALVGNNQVLINSDNFAVAFTEGTCTNRIIETEHMNIRFIEFHPIHLKGTRENTYPVILHEMQITFTLSKAEGSLNGICIPCE